MSIQQMLLNKLKQSNPNGYNRLMQLKNSGRSPNDILSEMYRSGEINDSQLNQIQRQGRLFGINISNSDIQKIKSIDVKTTPTSTNKKFGGWF